MPSTNGPSASEKINPRRTALGILIQLEKRRSNSGVLLAESLQTIAAAGDRNLITDLVLGTLRWRSWLDFLIQSFSKRSSKSLDTNVRLILQLGLYQLLYTRIPQHAALNETVELCTKMKLSSAASFVNAILRAVQKQMSQLPEPSREDTASFLATRFSHPQWLVRRWLNRFGMEETKALLEMNNQPGFIYIRANELILSVPELKLHLAEEKVHLVETEFDPGVFKVLEGTPQQTHSFARGEFYIQDPGAEWIGKSIDLQPGSEILEIAAAPGGKTFQLALRMQDRGKIVSVDSELKRMRLWSDNILRLKIKSAVPMVADGRFLAFQRRFDAVVIDAPCSSLGIVRRHPEIKWWRTEEDLYSFQVLQLQILDAGAKYVQESGHLYYSVCSYEPEETTEVAQKFLSHHPEFQQVDCLTLFPQQNNTDGFFLVSFSRGQDK